MTEMTEETKEKKSLFVEMTNFWTRAVQIILLILVGFFVVSIMALVIVPEFGYLVFGNLTADMASNTFELVRAWVFPMLFLVIVLSAATIAICRWFLKVSTVIMEKVRKHLIGHHNKALARQRSVQLRKQAKKGKE